MSIVKTILGYQRLYRRLMGGSVYLLIVVMLGASLAEGLGVLMFMPLLEEINTSDSDAHIGRDIHHDLVCSWIGDDS